MLESAVETHLCDLVAAHGGRADKLIDKSRNGGPDREVQWPFAAHPFRCCGVDKVELKKPLGRARDEQVRYHEFYARCGIPVYLLDTKKKVDEYISARLVGKHLPHLFSVPCDVVSSW